MTATTATGPTSSTRSRRRVRRTPPPARSRWVRTALYTALALATLAVLAVYVFPTRTWLDQRESQRDANAQLDELEAEKAALEARQGQLDTDEHVELIARSQYGLVKPGEEAYAVLPAPDPPIALPEVWPFGAMLPDLSTTDGD